MLKMLTYGSLVRSPSFSMLHHTQKLGGASHGDEAKLGGASHGDKAKLGGASLGDEAKIINLRVSGYSCQSVVESFEDVR